MPTTAERTLADAVFRPRSVALVGVSTAASKSSSLAWRNLHQGGYAREIYRVHPRKEQVDGAATFGRVEDLPDGVDVAPSADDGTSVIALIMDRVGDGARFRDLCQRAHEAGTHVLAFRFGNSAPERDTSRACSALHAGEGRVCDAFERAHVIQHAVGTIIDQLIQAAEVTGERFDTLELNRVRVVAGPTNAVALDALGVLSGVHQEVVGG